MCDIKVDGERCWEQIEATVAEKYLLILSK